MSRPSSTSQLVRDKRELQGRIDELEYALLQIQDLSACYKVLRVIYGASVGDRVVTINKLAREALLRTSDV